MSQNISYQFNSRREYSFFSVCSWEPLQHHPLGLHCDWPIGILHHCRYEGTGWNRSQPHSQTPRLLTSFTCSIINFILSFVKHSIKFTKGQIQLVNLSQLFLLSKQLNWKLMVHNETWGCGSLGMRLGHLHMLATLHYASWLMAG